MTTKERAVQMPCCMRYLRQSEDMTQCYIDPSSLRSAKLPCDTVFELQVLWLAYLVFCSQTLNVMSFKGVSDAVSMHPNLQFLLLLLLQEPSVASVRNFSEDLIAKTLSFCLSQCRSLGTSHVQLSSCPPKCLRNHRSCRKLRAKSYRSKILYRRQ